MGYIRILLHVGYVRRLRHVAYVRSLVLPIHFTFGCLQQQPLAEITKSLFFMAVLHGRSTVLASIFPGKLLIADIGRSHAVLIGLPFFALAVILGAVRRSHWVGPL